MIIMRNLKTVITGTALIAAAGLGLGACGTKTVIQHDAAPRSAAATTAPAATSPAASDTTGAVGDTFKMTGQGSQASDGSTTTWEVTVLKVVSHAAPASSFDTAPAGDYLVGAEFKITGVAGTSGSDINNDALVQGSDQQSYQPAMENVAAGTNFNSGDWTVAPGQTQVGWASFEIKDGVRPASVEFAIGGPGMDLSDTATWTT
jgi:hypothetical protein